jgi:hypothetical protein
MTPDPLPLNEGPHLRHGNVLLVSFSIALTACAARNISLQDVAGLWQMRALSETSDSVLTTYHLWTSPDPTEWKLKFDNREDTLRVQVLGVDGDSIMVQVGPYSSALRPNVSVTTRSTYRLIDSKLTGRSVARYSVTTADSVRRVRTEGTRIR